jgi:hypothetical protein
MVCFNCEIQWTLHFMMYTKFIGNETIVTSLTQGMGITSRPLEMSRWKFAKSCCETKHYYTVYYKSKSQSNFDHTFKIKLIRQLETNILNQKEQISSATRECGATHNADTI